jgi:hypothetical protein
VSVVNAGVEQLLDLNDGHAGLLGYLVLAETIMVEPPNKRGKKPAQSGGKGKR